MLPKPNHDKAVECIMYANQYLFTGGKDGKVIIF